MDVYLMSLSPSIFRTSTKSLSTALGLIGAGFFLSASPTTSAQAAGSYYNCAVPNGCEIVNQRQLTSNYTATKYPIVLAHGFLGWNRVFKSLDYFYGIPQTLMRGGSEVYTTKVSAVNSTDVRGEQLLKQIKVISAISGSDKVNLIGHSQGGMDSRYIAGVAPQYVASVTGISTPVQGSDLADWVIKKIKDGSAEDGYAEGELNPASQTTLNIFNFLGKVLDVSSGIAIDDIQEQDGFGALGVLTEQYSHEFNARFPNATPTEYCGYSAETKVNGIEYYSFSGGTVATNAFDISDPILLATGLTFDEPTDGLVQVCSSHLGRVIRDDYRMNHLDTINQFFGLVSMSETNPLSVYRSQVNRLMKDEL